MAGVSIEYATLDEGQGISLSLRIYKPPSLPAAGKDLAIILVHQYSVLGGCQALLKGMSTSLARKGFTCVTFDMRGVKRSTGRPSLTGASEVQDVVAVCHWAAANLPSSRLLVVGSSAGAPIAGSAVDQTDHIVGYVALGYPFGRLASILFGRHHKPILESSKPKLFVMGTNDGFTSVKQLESKLKTAAGRVEMHLVPGVGHFQMEGPDYDEQMVNLITEFASKL